MFFSGAMLNVRGVIDFTESTVTTHCTEARALSEAISQADEEALETALLKVRLKMNREKVWLKLNLNISTKCSIQFFIYI